MDVSHGFFLDISIVVRIVPKNPLQVPSKAAFGDTFSAPTTSLVSSISIQPRKSLRKFCDCSQYKEVIKAISVWSFYHDTEDFFFHYRNGGAGF